jgi:hypothetical protein
MKNWFEVDPKGLAQILERKGKEFIVFELIQNAFDANNVKSVEVSLRHKEGRSYSLEVQDDSPEGFKNMAHSYTIFAPSEKKSDVSKRGRFNLGEKLVLAMCDSMEIVTTQGGIRFDDEGRHALRRKIPSGTLVSCVLKLKKEEYEEMLRAAQRVLIPADCELVVNNMMQPRRSALHSFDVALPTEIGDAEGFLRKSERQTRVELFELKPGESPRLYELGIPVCETDFPWDVNVCQKIPLTLDRDAVTPAFLKKLRVAVLNETHNIITPEDANKAWTTEAVESPECKPEALSSYLDERFGEQRVAYDPSDAEANKLAVASGYTVVTGRMLSGAAWDNIKREGLIRPAGQVTPSSKVWDGENNPDAKECPPIPEEQWNDGMRGVADYAKKVAGLVLGRSISVKFFSSPHMLAAAAYGPGHLSFNKMRLHNVWFDLGRNQESIDNLLIHEFGHEYSGDHLSKEYNDALTKIGAKMVQFARVGKI